MACEKIGDTIIVLKGKPGPPGPPGCVVPSGCILMWSGNPNALPEGFVLCDGQQYVGQDEMIHTAPDLRGRFVVGFDATAPAIPQNAVNMEINYGAVNNTGGINFPTLSVAQMPTHSHGATTDEAGQHIHNGNTSTNGLHNHGGTTEQSGLHSHDVSADGSHTHPFNIPRVFGIGVDFGVAQADSPDGSEGYLTGSSGLHTHNLSQAGLHTHMFTTASAGTHMHMLNISPAGEHVHNVIVQNTGGSQPHENRPPYYVLAFIIKT